MNVKKEARQRRAKSTRLKIRELGAVRLCVNRTPRHIYAQVISACGGKF
jgi:large subunit ribosomal protein L18